MIILIVILIVIHYNYLRKITLRVNYGNSKLQQRQQCQNARLKQQTYEAYISTLHTPQRLPLQILLRMCIGEPFVVLLSLDSDQGDLQRGICGGGSAAGSFQAI